jgi:hypothetical protein
MGVGWDGMVIENDWDWEVRCLCLDAYCIVCLVVKTTLHALVTWRDGVAFALLDHTAHLFISESRVM